MLICPVHGCNLTHSRYTIGYDSKTGEAIRPIVCRRCERLHSIIWAVAGFAAAASLLAIGKAIL